MLLLLVFRYVFLRRAEIKSDLNVILKHFHDEDTEIFNKLLLVATGKQREIRYILFQL